MRDKEFLPVRAKSSGHKVYAGFWPRLVAGLADTLILLPFTSFFIWLEGLDRALAIIVTIPSYVLFAMYNVFFNARFGGTLGKLAVGIRITRPDGSRIGWAEAWKRSAVDLVFAFIMLLVEVWGLTQVDPDRYVTLGWVERAQLVNEHAPAWFGSVGIFHQVWIWSEVVVLLFNARKRAIHDFIAGTVVIDRAFVRSGDRSEQDAA